MKASSLPGLAVVLAGLIVAVPLRYAQAQDFVIRKSGQKVEGKITGTSGNNLKIQLENGAVSIPLADVRELSMQPPPEFEAAAAQLSRGDAKGSVAALQKITAEFAGLDAPWFRRAGVMLGDAKLAAGDKEGAKAAYEEFAKANPTATGLASLGMARLALESGDAAGAAKLLAPVLARAPQSALPPRGEGSSFCQAYYLMGRVKEAEGDKAAALENYLKASALFPFDQNAVADATKRSDALRADNPGLIVP